MYTYWLILVGSVIAECTTRSWQGWLVAKLLAGIGVGCVQSTVPAYISEVAPTRIRGALLMAYSFWWTLGSFFAQVALQHLSRSDPTDYLTPVYTQWAQLGVMLLIYLLVPETPAWCVSAGKLDRAKKELLKLHRGVKDYDADHQLQVLVLAIEHERAVAIEQRRENGTPSSGEPTDYERSSPSGRISRSNSLASPCSGRLARISSSRPGLMTRSESRSLPRPFRSARCWYWWPSWTL